MTTELFEFIQDGSNDDNSRQSFFFNWHIELNGLNKFYDLISILMLIGQNSRKKDYYLTVLVFYE